MWARLAWAMTLVMAFFDATSTVPADVQDWTTPAMSDETSLLQTRSQVSADRSEKKAVMGASAKHEDSSKYLSASGGTEAKAKAELGPAVDLHSTENVARNKAGEAQPAGSTTTEGIAAVQAGSTTTTASSGGSGSGGVQGLLATNGFIIFQLLFGILYYFIFIGKRAELWELKDDSMVQNRKGWNNNGPMVQKGYDIYKRGPLRWLFCCDCLRGGLWNCFYGFLCFGPHGGRTLHFANIGPAWWNYWPSCIAMACCPCITVAVAHLCCPLERHLTDGAAPDRVCCGTSQAQSVLGYMFTCGNCTSKPGYTCAMVALSIFCSCCVIAHDAAVLDQARGKRTFICGYKDLESLDCG